jgi:hypothetical protein
MIYKMLPLAEGEQQIYARIDDDGLCRLTCTADYPEFKAWVDAGNTPEPADEPPADEPPADEPPADEPPADEPPVDEPPVDEPPVDEVIE